MLPGYLLHGMNHTAVFELSMRTLPPSRNFLIAAGLEQVVCYLEELRIREDELERLRANPSFRPDFLDWLGRLRFTRGVHPMPRSTAFFPNEPVVRLIAPLPQAPPVQTRTGHPL